MFKKNQGNLSIKLGFAALVVFVLLLGFFVYSFLKDSQDNTNVTVNIEKAAIVQEIQSLNRLETVKQVINRELEITLDDNDFEIFGWTILESERTQKLNVTGSIIAGIDLKKIDTDDIELSNDGKKVEITLPPAEILSVKIESDVDIIKDKLTLLFKLKNLSSDRKDEMNELMLQQTLEQSRVALADAACKDNILSKANENAKDAIKKPFGSLLFEEIIVNDTAVTECKYEDVDYMD